jgi:hypothetical protein
MASVHKLLGRLNATTCRFDIGRGGIPELTPQDIAGALGMIRDEFAREVFCAVWWPDGAKLVAKELDRIIAGMQFGEWKSRFDAMLDAQLKVAQAELRSDRREVHAARAALEHAKSEMWPALREDAYRLVRLAAVEELRAPKSCPTCQGRATAKVGELVVSCSACDGSGVVPVSNRRRAASMQVNESTYRRVWQPVYEWTYRRISDAEHAGAREFAIRIAA